VKAIYRTKPAIEFDGAAFITLEELARTFSRLAPGGGPWQGRLDAFDNAVLKIIVVRGEVGDVVRHQAESAIMWVGRAAWKRSRH